MKGQANNKQWNTLRHSTFPFKYSTSKPTSSFPINWYQLFMGIQRLPKIFLTFSISNIFFVCPHPQCLFLCFFLHLSTKIIYDNFSQGKDIPKNGGNKHTLAILGSNYHSCIFLNHHNMPTYVLFLTRS